MLKLLRTLIFCTALGLGFGLASSTAYTQVIPQAEQEMLDEPPTGGGLFDGIPEDDGMGNEDLEDADPLGDAGTGDDATDE